MPDLTRIAEGRTAEFYAWEPGLALKLFRPSVSAKTAACEAEKAGLAQQRGIPAPKVFELIEVGGRAGILYERIDGPTLFANLGRQPWQMFTLSRQLAELHADIHARHGDRLVKQKVRLEHAIRRAPHLGDAHRRAALGRLAELPDGDALCHGDFHPDNIINSTQGAVIIDWLDAHQGDPVADVARSQLLFLSVTRPDAGVLSPIQRLGLSYMLKQYLNCYFAIRPEGRERLSDWLGVLAAARLHEEVEGEADWLLKLVSEHFGTA